MGNNGTYKQPWLPTTKKEIEHLGWEEIDVILFSGDAYIDHPSMGCAVIGRVLESRGYKVAIVNGESYNIKITNITDLKIADSLSSE